LFRKYLSFEERVGKDNWYTTQSLTAQILDNQSDLSDFFKNALTIIEAAKQKHIELRLMGATAIYYRCPESRQLTDTMNRPLTDLDFMTLSKYVRHIPDLFSSLGFEGNERVNTLYGLRRQIYTDPRNGRHVDIFVDKLTFCHEVDLTRRLVTDPITLTLADLLLEKMQIVKIGEKDVKDTVILLREHELGDEDNDTINMRYIAELLADDWGFYYTVTTNLKKTRDYVDTLQMLKPDEKGLVQSRIDALLDGTEKEGKSLKWRMRAAAGTKVKWYNEAEEVEDRGTGEYKTL
jgi:hypothetical protein